MSDETSRKIVFFKERIKEHLDKLRSEIGETRYRIYMDTVNSCDDFDTLREMAEMEMQIEMAEYIREEVQARLAQDGIDIRCLRAVNDEHYRASIELKYRAEYAKANPNNPDSLSAIQKEEKQELLAKKNAAIIADLDSPELLLALSLELATRESTTPQEELEREKHLKRIMELNNIADAMSEVEDIDDSELAYEDDEEDEDEDELNLDFDEMDDLEEEDDTETDDIEPDEDDTDDEEDYIDLGGQDADEVEDDVTPHESMSAMLQSNKDMFEGVDKEEEDDFDEEEDEEGEDPLSEMDALDEVDFEEGVDLEGMASLDEDEDDDVIEIDDRDLDELEIEDEEDEEDDIEYDDSGFDDEEEYDEEEEEQDEEDEDFDDIEDFEDLDEDMEDEDEELESDGDIQFDPDDDIEVEEDDDVMLEDVEVEDEAPRKIGRLDDGEDEDDIFEGLDESEFEGLEDYSQNTEKTKKEAPKVEQTTDPKKAETKSVFASDARGRKSASMFGFLSGVANKADRAIVNTAKAVQTGVAKQADKIKNMEVDVSGDEDDYIDF